MPDDRPVSPDPREPTTLTREDADYLIDALAEVYEQGPPEGWKDAAKDGYGVAWSKLHSIYYGPQAAPSPREEAVELRRIADEIGMSGGHVPARMAGQIRAIADRLSAARPSSPPSGIENGVAYDASCVECGQRVEHRNGAWICPTHCPPGEPDCLPCVQSAAIAKMESVLNPYRKPAPGETK